MSGGHFDYQYYHLDQYIDEAEDAEIIDLLKDVRDLLHDLEWYKSGDYSHSEYIETVDNFKQKWFKASRNERLAKLIGEQCDDFKNKLKELVGA